jgi:hypothetical protein
VLDGPVHAEYTFTSSWNLQVGRGDYTYLLWIAGQGPLGGSFRINNIDKHTMLIPEDRVNFQYP